MANQFKFNRDDAKFVKEMLGKKVGFQMGVRPVGSVDEKQMVIHDVAVCIQGEALGHGVWLDEEFIKAVVAQGNAAENGLLCHFGHESSNASRIKNYMGVFSNFVEKPAKDHEGNDCIGAYADIKFSKTAKEMSDNVDWVMKLARERPDALGLSIVFDVSDYKVKTADGDLLWSEFWADKEPKTWDEYFDLCEEFFGASVDGKLYVVMNKLYGADFVAEGAATDGLFTRGLFARGDADEIAEALRSPFKALAKLAEKEAEPAEPAAEAPRTEEDPKAETEDAPAEGEDKGEAESGESAAEAPAEAEQQEAATEEPAAPAAESLAKLEEMKAGYEKRLAGFQSMHDKKVAELNAKISEDAEKFAAAEKDFRGQIEKLTKELDAAKAELSASKSELEKKAGELAEIGDRLQALTSAHRKLTGGALTVGDTDSKVKTMSEFVKDHGGRFDRAVSEDPDTYRRICLANGWEPVALRNR